MGISKPIVPLTDEQRKLAEKHEHLIWDFIKWHNLGLGNQELKNDWYCVLAEGYIAAARKYQGLGKFETFARKCMVYSMQTRGRYNNSLMRSSVCVLSIDQPIDEDGGDLLTLQGILPDSRASAEDEAVGRMAADEFWNRLKLVLKDRHQEAIRLKAFYEGDSKGATAHSGMSLVEYTSRVTYAKQLIKTKVLPALRP